MPSGPVKIFGERHSGTNLLRQIIARNSSHALWPGTIEELGNPCLTEVQTRCGESGLKERDASIYRECIRDEIFARYFEMSLGWKHAAPSLDRIIRNPRFQETHFIVIAKNPYAWLLSMYRAPYHNLLVGNTRSFSVFLRSPWLTTRRDNAPGAFQNPVELWNYKYRAYKQLSQIAPVAFVRYEDILEDPAVIFSIGEIHRDLTHPLDIPQCAVQGGTNTFNSYRDMYRERFWTTRIGEDDMAIINKNLDRDVLSHLGYHTY